MHSLQRELPWCSLLPGSVVRFVTGKHPLRSAFMLAAAFCAALTSTSVAAADIAQATQNYPSKAIRLIVPDSAGGSPDVMARLIANELTKQMGQQVVVDNRPGASGIIGFEALAKAPADGYTFGFSTFSFITNPSLYATLPYDPVKDFQPLVHSNSSTFLLTVSPALPVKSTQELIDYARAQPGKLSSGHNGVGFPQFLGLELFKLMTNTQIVQVPYKAIQQAITDAISGQVHIVIDNAPSILPHVRAGRMRALGVLTPKRNALLPDIPTVAEGGVPGFDMVPIGGYVMPANAPRDIVLRLNAELNKALKSPIVVEKFSTAGLTIEGGTPEQHAERLRRETEKWAGVIKAAGIKQD